MKPSGLTRSRFSYLPLVLLLAACGGLQPISPVSFQPTSGFSAYGTRRHTYKVLYSFKGSPDGSEPFAGLVALSGSLYGTTYSGGGYHGPGLVFRITKAGKESVVFSFGYGSQSGYHPSSGLVALDGTLYGSALGGNENMGVVYTITASGHESVLYNFKGIPDGSEPSGALTPMHGKLYGTTDEGGSGKCSNAALLIGCGTVFELSTSGKERVLYSFRGGRDGEAPVGRLVEVNGALYGTTFYGGDVGACSGGGCGTVFSVTTSGRERVLYRFKGPPADLDLSNGLVALNGVLYGTGRGGTNGKGGVFAVTLSGTESILYNFTGGANGSNPSARLAVVNGFLYGTTQNGGYNKNYCSRGGCGTVFKVSTSGAQEVLYRFRGYPGDGKAPMAEVTSVNGNLYGTTESGGSGDDGTVFRVAP